MSHHQSLNNNTTSSHHRRSLFPRKYRQTIHNKEETGVALAGAANVIASVNDDPNLQYNPPAVVMPKLKVDDVRGKELLLNENMTVVEESRDDSCSRRNGTEYSKPKATKMTTTEENNNTTSTYQKYLDGKKNDIAFSKTESIHDIIDETNIHNNDTNCDENDGPISNQQGKSDSQRSKKMTSTSKGSSQTAKNRSLFHRWILGTVTLMKNTTTTTRDKAEDSKSQDLLPTLTNKDNHHEVLSSPISSTFSYRSKMEQFMEAVSKSYGDDELAKTNHPTNQSGLSATELAAGQLMHWKTQAEEGPLVVQSMAFVLALATSVTTLYPIIMIPTYWNVSNWIVAFHTVNLCILIMVFELRRYGLSLKGSFHIRAKIRAVFSRYFNILRLVWGRGLLYVFAGSMNMAGGWPVAVYTGIPLAVVGIWAIFWGARASFNLDRLRSSVTDEVYLWTKFDDVDDDGDEMIGVDGFSSLVWSLGLEVNDKYTYETFLLIDKDKNGLISFDDFKGWWLDGQEEEETNNKHDGGLP
ncbi:hypothetical protein IV203_027169 [Nitzschia inconspicua]|uniref:EF-hand domain-containing protein n=1 Tax=Nitzschia inconspicua TaxID=303405 RepID=A0A9K3PXZ9_9STRA|nr:hypothetical protein IV203_027169 [Nitzschia inconspicua]